MGHPSRSMKNSSAEDNLYYEVPAQEISEGKILPSGPETIFVIFWQKKKMWLYFALALKMCLRLN